MLTYTFTPEVTPEQIDKLHRNLEMAGIGSTTSEGTLTIIGPQDLTVKQAFNAGVLVGLTDARGMISSLVKSVV